MMYLFLSISVHFLANPLSCGSRTSGPKVLSISCIRSLYWIGYACDFSVHILACRSTCLWQWFFSTYISAVVVNLKMLHTCDRLHFNLSTELVLLRGLLLPYSLLFFRFTTLLFLQAFALVSVDHLDLIFALNWLCLRGLLDFGVGAGHITYNMHSVITLMLAICLLGYSYSQNHEPGCF
jgi:hypothetical protein